jgi:hypothetical protein
MSFLSVVAFIASHSSRHYAIFADTTPPAD